MELDHLLLEKVFPLLDLLDLLDLREMQVALKERLVALPKVGYKFECGCGEG